MPKIWIAPAAKHMAKEIAGYSWRNDMYQMGFHVKYDDDGFPEPYPTAAAADIAERLIPEAWARFRRGNIKYRSVPHLGAKGVLPDINRKTAALLRVLWDGEEEAPGAEPVREIMLDLLGHLYLALHLLDEETDDGGDDAELVEAVRREFLAMDQKDGGWDYLPEEVQKAIVMLANGFEVVSTPEIRRQAAQYLSEHGRDGG